MVILIFLKDLFDQKRLLKSAYLEVNNMKQVAHKYLRYTLRALLQKIQIHIHLIKERERLTEITSVIDLLNNSSGRYAECEHFPSRTRSKRKK